MRHFRYRDLLLWKTEWESIMNDLRAVRSKELSSVAAAFIANAERTAAAAITPAQIAYTVRRDQNIADCAINNTTGKLEPNLSQFELAPSKTEEYTKEFERLAAEFIGSQTLEERHNALGRWGVLHIETLLENIKGMQSG